MEDFQQTKFSNVRKNGTVGVIEETGLHGKVNIHFAEWWSGEGMDYSIDYGKEEGKKIELHLDEIRALVIAAILGGQIDIEECAQEASRIEHESDLRELHIKQLKRKFGPM